MVTQRTTLISLSFFAIVLGRNVNGEDVKFLWTGIDVPYSDLKVGLISVIIMYLLSYLMKWFAENKFLSYPRANELASLAHELNFGQEKHEREKEAILNNAEVPPEVNKKITGQLLKYHSVLTLTANRLNSQIETRKGVGWVQHIAFTLVVPFLVPLYALCVLFRS